MEKKFKAGDYIVYDFTLEGKSHSQRVICIITVNSIVRSAEYKNLILVISSVIFFTWGRPAIILLLFLTIHKTVQMK